MRHINILLLAFSLFIVIDSVAQLNLPNRNFQDNDLIEEKIINDTNRSDSSMVFKHFQIGRGVWGQWIYADGTITSSTPSDFLNFIDGKFFSNIVVINSKGGNLMAALKLGEIFRDLGVTIKVGKTYFFKTFYP